MTQSLNSPVQPLAPLYQVGWQDYDAGWQVGGFWKDPNGLVHLRGLVSSTGATSQVTTALPEGFRSASAEIFNQSGDTPGTSIRVDVQGAMITCQVSGAIAYVSLAGITFLAGV